MKQPLDDKSRFLSVLELLPEQLVDDFVNYYLYNANYPRGFNEILEKYHERKNEILSQFSNAKINTSYKELNNSFNTLRSFLIKHFYVPKSHYEMHEDPPFFYLEPRIHHNFRLSEGGERGEENEDSKEWNKYKSELDRIAKEFEGAYKDFIKTAQKEIERKQKTVAQTEKWYQTWWGILILGIIASGVVALMFL